MTISRTYNLPTPAAANNKRTTWFTGHLVETDGELAHDGTVAHYPRRLTITVDTHRDKPLVLDYADAKRIALAILAAVEQANTQQENQ